MGELLRSIAANGCLDIEPLIVLLGPADQKFTVIEGNRRLAALRLFRETELVDAVATNDRVKIGAPRIAPAAQATLDKVSVYRVRDRDAA